MKCRKVESLVGLSVLLLILSSLNKMLKVKCVLEGYLLRKGMLSDWK